jgi:hypothetical protein
MQQVLEQLCREENSRVHLQVYRIDGLAHHASDWAWHHYSPVLLKVQQCY